MASGVATKLDEIYLDLTLNVTRNIGKAHSQLMWAFDMCWFSPVSFEFQGMRVRKGVIELLVIGDTRTGKSTTVERMLAHYQQGDFIQGDAITEAGLIAGIDEAGGRRFLKAGRLPLAHRRGFVIDEANSIPQEIIGRLSGVRSSGMIDIVKIVGGRIPCLTRMVWIANCRGDKKLAEYGYGIEAIPDLIGKPEDVARFDIFVGISHRDIDAKYLSMHSRDFPTTEHIHTAEACHKHLSWVWSRTYDQWILSEETEDAILINCDVLATRYDDTIPICIHTELRIQIARLSCATAARVGSCDGSMEKIIVKKEHVEEAVERFMECLDSNSLAYGDWSMRRSETSFGSEMEKVLQSLGVKGMKALLTLQSVRISDVNVIIGSPDDGKKIYQKLLLNGGLTRIAAGATQLTENLVVKLKSSIASGRYGEEPNPGAMAQPETGEENRDGDLW